MRSTNLNRSPILHHLSSSMFSLVQHLSIGKGISCDFAENEAAPNEENVNTNAYAEKKMWCMSLRVYMCIYVYMCVCVCVCVCVSRARVPVYTPRVYARTCVTERDRQMREREGGGRGREGEREREGEGMLGKRGGGDAAKRRKKTVRPVAPSLAHKYKHSPLSVCAPSTGGLRVANIMVCAGARARARAHTHACIKLCPYEY